MTHSNTASEPEQPAAAGGRWGALRAPLLTALVLAVASCGAHAMLRPEQGRAFAGVLVGALGGVYLGGALRGKSGAEVIVSVVAAVICVVLGAWGLLGPGWIIPAAFIAHGTWDWMHHALERRTVGRWWPPFCALYDFIVGVYLFVDFARWTR